MSEPNDPLSDLLDDFDTVSGTAAKTDSGRTGSARRSRPGPGGYRSALDEAHTDRRRTAQATGKKATVAGQYVRRSFTFRPDQLQEIERVAAQLSLSQNDLIRWFTDLGLETVAQGKHPPIATEVRHRYNPGQH
jgi:hypothetical protein